MASKVVLDVFWKWIEETSSLYTTNEKLITALGYAKNQKKYLETFLEDGRLSISNNYCETHIRPFATARRAWLFADTPKGAFANAVLYTLVETAKENHLNIYQYLSGLPTREDAKYGLSKSSRIIGCLSSLVGATTRRVQKQGN